MALINLTKRLKLARLNTGPARTLNGDGYLRYAIDHCFWRGDGFNSAKATSGTVTVDFTPILNATPGSRAIINIAQGNGDNIALELVNTTAANVTYVSLLLAAINGPLRGYTATAVGNVVTITGRPGLRFILASALFTTNPIIAAVSAPVCPGVLPYGVAIGIDPVVNASQVIKGRENSSLAKDPSRILTLDTGSPTWSFVGITCRNEFDNFDFNPDCCDNLPAVVAGYDCHDCAHYLKADHMSNQQIKVTLEVPTAGDTNIANWIGTPVSRRVSAGTFSIGAPVGDLTRKLARNVASGAQFVVADVVDVATRQVFLQVTR